MDRALPMQYSTAVCCVVKQATHGICNVNSAPARVLKQVLSTGNGFRRIANVEMNHQDMCV